MDRTSILRKACIESCVRIRPALTVGIPNSPVVIDFTIGYWYTIIDEELIASVVSQASCIALYFRNIDVYNGRLFAAIAKHVGPKLVEIHIIDCDLVSWKIGFKSILAATRSLQVFASSRNSWFDDDVLDQISKKFKKSLLSLSVESSPMTDVGLFNICHRCLQVRELVLSSCSRITNAGLRELSKKLHLSKLHILHHVSITDVAIENLMASCRDLVSVDLTNCPKLTDRAVAAFFECKTAWGIKRNTETQSLNSLVIRDNNELTSNMMTFVSASLSNITHLDLRDCPNLGVTKGLQQIDRFQCLESLMLGPQSEEVSSDGDIFVKSLSYHMGRLKVLHLVGLVFLSDEQLSQLFSAGDDVLETLLLSDLNVGTMTAEALCNCNPNIHRLTVKGSDVLRDIDVRCINSVCLHLTEFTVQRCPRLSNGAFSRLQGLKRLKKLDIGFCSSLLDPTVLHFVRECKRLDHLVLDGLKFDHMQLEMMGKFEKTLAGLRSLSLRSCSGVGGAAEMADVHFLVGHLPRCETLDLTNTKCNFALPTRDSVGASRGTVESSLLNPHPFLTYVQDGDFTGYSLSSSANVDRVQYLAIATELRRASAASLIQLTWRAISRLIRVLEDKESVSLTLYAQQVASKLQTCVRKWLLRLRMNRRKAAATLIRCFLRRNLFQRRCASITKGSVHYRTRSKLISVRIWQQRKRESFRKFKRLEWKVVSRIQQLIIDRAFSIIMTKHVECKQGRLDAQYEVIWEGSILPKILRRWKSILGHTSTRRKKLVSVFLNCVSIASLNSFKQQASVAAVNHFRSRRLILPVWALLAAERLHALAADALLPIAVTHGERKFFGRVVTATYRSLCDYRLWRKLKRRNEALASEKYFRRRNIVGICAICNTLARWRSLKKLLLKGSRGYVQYRWKQTFDPTTGLVYNSYVRKFHRDLYPVTDAHYNRNAMTRGIDMFLESSRRFRWFSDQSYRADMCYVKNLKTLMVKFWNVYTAMEKDMLSFCQQRYNKKRWQRVFAILKVGWQERKQYLADLAANVSRQRQRSERMAVARQSVSHGDGVVVDAIGLSDAFDGPVATVTVEEEKRSVELFILSITRCQARYRGYRVRKKVSKRIEKLYAISILQRFGRRGLALLKYKRVKRLFVLQEKSREMQEAVFMRTAEAEMVFLVYLEAAATAIQKSFRGLVARQLRDVLARDSTRLTGIKSYEQEVRNRVAAQINRKRRRVAEVKKAKCATVMTALVRGYLGRKCFARKKLQRYHVVNIIKIQTNFRAHLARLKLQSLRRAKYEEIRRRIMHRQRGLFNRFFGFDSTSASFKIIENLGLDILTYNLRLDALLADTMADFFEFMRIVRREAALLVRHPSPFDMNERWLSRRAMIGRSQPELKVFDAIRITQFDHRYFGYSGQIVRIDKNVQGFPLFEVKLDEFQNKVVYVNMPTDALVVYDRPYANAFTVAANPKLPSFPQPFKIFGITSTKVSVFSNLLQMSASAFLKRKKSLKNDLESSYPLLIEDEQSNTKLSFQVTGDHSNRADDQGSLDVEKAPPDDNGSMVPFDRNKALDISMRKSKKLSRRWFISKIESSKVIKAEGPGAERYRIYMAWTIQRAYRCHRARKIVGRLRFEALSRAEAMQWNLVTQLADTNTLTANANVVTRLLNVLPHSTLINVKLSEVMHHLIPGRFRIALDRTRITASRIIKKESEVGDYTIDCSGSLFFKNIMLPLSFLLNHPAQLIYHQRAKFMQEVIGPEFYSRGVRLANDRDGVFSLGADRLTWARKRKLLIENFSGIFVKRDKAAESRKQYSFLDIVSGSRGMHALASKKVTVTGLDIYRFKQFRNSPYVRFAEAFLYQGEWMGIPLVQELKPHGQGLVIFLDGWGLAKETKELHLTILGCHNLSASDPGNSYPYCHVVCNYRRYMTSARVCSLSPVYTDASFTIPVTNPEEIIRITVWGEKTLLPDEFLGRVDVAISDFASGRKVHRRYELGGAPFLFNLDTSNKFDYGEVEIVALWENILLEEDFRLMERKTLHATRLQAHARKIIAKRKLDVMRKGRREFLDWANKMATRINNFFRSGLARKQLKRLVRDKVMLEKIKKRLRVYISKFRLRKLRKLVRATIVLQMATRRFVAIRKLIRLCIARDVLWDRCARLMQRCSRGLVGRLKTIKIRDAKERLLLQRERDIQGRIALLIEEGQGARLTQVEWDQSRNDDDDANVDEKILLSEVDGKRVKGTRWSSLTLNRYPRCFSLPPDILPKIPVSEWIHVYGVDTEYYLRRNRRLTENAFERMLKAPYLRVVAKTFGIVYIDNYPALECIGFDSSLREREDFLVAHLPSFKPNLLRKQDAIKALESTRKTALLRLRTTVLVRESVNYNITILQCAVRQWIAKSLRNGMVRDDRYARMIQRTWKRHVKTLNTMAIRIQGFSRIIAAKNKKRYMRIEKFMAITLQCTYRSYKAREKLFVLRSVQNVSVLKSSSFVSELFGPHQCLIDDFDHFWMAASPDFAEVRFEFRNRAEYVSEVWILATLFTASPKLVSIDTVLEKASKQFVNILPSMLLPMKKGRFWHRLILPTPAHSKYFKVTFRGNYGDARNIGIRRICFLRRKEKSPVIIEQSKDCIIANGPSLDTTKVISLECKVDAWPPPTFQWFRNNKPIAGATNSVLQLSLVCDAKSRSCSNRTRFYRCRRCHLVCEDVPFLAFTVECDNCLSVFSFSEIEEYEAMLTKLHSVEADLLRQRSMYLLSKDHLELMVREKCEQGNVRDELQRVLGCIAEVEASIVEVRRARYIEKNSLKNANHYSNEGFYRCKVSNIRSGVYRMRVTSKEITVAVERPTPLRVKMHPTYTPRKPRPRRRFPVYSSIVGTFTSGRLEGLVTIRFDDGAYYEGPFVDDGQLDDFGYSLISCRGPNHFGVYTCADGRIFEGANVDNHFDSENLQAFYRMIVPKSGEEYEGEFCDEMFHGVGKYTYFDGSVYEGRWHRGARFGHGLYRSSEGWTYEGSFNKDLMHGKGSLTWPDGRWYCGEFRFSKRTGRGIFLSRQKDLYKGDFVDGRFEGRGELVCCDGSRYSGEFKNNWRHGRGVYVDREGNEYYCNTFFEDMRHGDVVVKLIIDMSHEDPELANYEINLAEYDRGHFVKWIHKFYNPVVTQNFIRLFSENKEMFDSTYSMIIAKNFPVVPDGIDVNNREIKSILSRIRLEGGMLVNQDALVRAQEHVRFIMKPIQDKKSQIASLIAKSERGIVEIMDCERTLGNLKNTCLGLVQAIEKHLRMVEKHWEEDKSESRSKFFSLIDEIQRECNTYDFHKFRDHRSPLPFVKKIADCFSYLLNLPLEWETQQTLFSDSSVGSLAGDAYALVHEYDCKLMHMLQKENFDVYSYAKIDHGHFDGSLGKILADARFRKDSYYIESCGKVAPFMVRLIKVMFTYIKNAKPILSHVRRADEKKREIVTLSRLIQNKESHLTALHLQQEAVLLQVNNARQDFEEMSVGLGKANDFVIYLQQTFVLDVAEVKMLDYYEVLEQKLMEKKEMFEVETTMMNLLDAVDKRTASDLRNNQIREMYFGRVFKEPVVRLEDLDLKDWIAKAVSKCQTKFKEDSRSAGNSCDFEANMLSASELKEQILACVDVISRKIDRALNIIRVPALGSVQVSNVSGGRELRRGAVWTSRKGRKITSRFIYVLVWKSWITQALASEEAKAVAAWEEIFRDPETCAARALEIDVNTRMSKTAKEHGRVWAKFHAAEVSAMEATFAAQFQNTYLEGAPSKAIEILSESVESPLYSAYTRACCNCWVKLHPSDFNLAVDQRDQSWSKDFYKKYKKKSGEVAFRILNGFAPKEDMAWADAALAWKAFHINEYEKSAGKLIGVLGATFEKSFPRNTRTEAARIITNHGIAGWILHKETRKRYEQVPANFISARCWGVKNQGLLRGSMAALKAAQERRADALWRDLKRTTMEFRKASRLYSSSSSSQFPVSSPSRRTDEAVEMIAEAQQAKSASPQDLEDQSMRERMFEKFAWLHGYLRYSQAALMKDLEALDSGDPHLKTDHGERPSERKSLFDKREKEYITEKKFLQRKMVDAVSKLSIWNTYFGPSGDYPNQ